MEAHNIILFQPVRTTWHELLKARNFPLISSSPKSSIAKKAISWSVNGVKNRFIELALVIATLFTTLYSLISYPIRSYQARNYERIAIQLDLARFQEAEILRVKKQLDAYFQKHNSHFDSLSPSEKKEWTDKIVSQVARTEKVYGPIVRNWADHLLEKAHQQKKKLIFMARDGIPFYEVAKELMKKEEYRKKYPRLAKEGALMLGHFSRKLVEQASTSEEAKTLFKDYVSKELKIQKGDQCLFVDVGFSGSMVKPIRSLLPEVKIDFQFLVATSDRAEGFLGSPRNPLPHLETAANNLGVRWIEESHHGNIASATRLIQADDQHIYPDSLYPKKNRSDEKFSLPYLIRKFCLKNLISYATRLPTVTKGEAVKAKELFSQTIGAIKNQELPLFVGWDY